MFEVMTPVKWPPTTEQLSSFEAAARPRHVQYLDNRGESEWRDGLDLRDRTRIDWKRHCGHGSP